MGQRHNRHSRRRDSRSTRLKQNVKRALGLKEPNLGDRGQRYEVWANFGGKAMRVGWAGQFTGLVGPLRSNPGVGRIVVVDREENRLLCCECGARSARSTDIDKKYCPTCEASLLDPRPDKPLKA